MRIAAARAAVNEAFAGVNGSAVVVIAIVALINTIRRSINWIFEPPFSEWLLGTAVSFVESAILGVLVVLAVAWTVNRTLPGWRQYAAVGLAVVVATGAGTVLLVIFEQPDWRTDPDMPHLVWWSLVVASMWLRYALIGLLVAGAWLYVRAEAAYAAAIAQCAVDAARSDEQIVQARLSMLEAQIEPHFLFNTLAHVKRLYDVDPANGRRMLTSLIAYLAVALPQMRETRSTLGREVAHATAYLDIQRMRMGPRLGVDVDVPESLRDAGMPPLMILTLVENAIKHGVGPQPGGGRIAIRAWDAGERLNVEVADTGQGFAHTSGGGTGLANIRSRLAALFGREASLSLRMNSPHGVVATIVLPRRAAQMEQRDEYARAA
jgi:signal transduction histidine kinase